MQVFINDNPVLVAESTSVQALLEKENLLRKEGMAIAINGSIIPRTEWDLTMLQNADRIDVISAFYGG
ncbi:MAG: sulfur carrier protein ThiS [Bacteroidales bacterium]|jgi:sulfur carrier protein|nr:sulfur carrier protein ThiS [Bacteroidales bacterium]